MSWQEFTIGEVCHFVRNGKSIKQSSDAGGLPITRIETIWNAEIDETKFGYANLTDADAGQYLLEDGDILLSHINSISHMGKCTIYEGRPQKLVHGMNLLCLRPNQQIIFPKFFLYLLRTNYFIANLLSLTNKSVNQASISATNLKSIKVELPPLAEQQRIAAILDKADALRTKRRAALAKLDTLLQATFLHMFGDPVTNPMGWERITFENLLDSIDSGWSPICEDRSARNDEWGVLKLGAITTCEYKDTENKALPNALIPIPKLEVKTGDLLFSRKNTYELVAACVLVRKTRSSLMLSDLIFRFNLKENSNLLPEYLWALLTHDGKRKTIQSLAGGAAGSMPNISKEKLKKIKIELPSLKNQQIFACFYNQIQKEKALQSDSLEKLNNLFHTLQQRAFKGEL